MLSKIRSKYKKYSKKIKIFKINKPKLHQILLFKHMNFLLKQKDKLEKLKKQAKKKR